MGHAPSLADRGTAVGPAFGDLLERQILGPARSIGVDLPVVAVTDPPPPLEVQASPHGRGGSPPRLTPTRSPWQTAVS
jgi:hypothetical protein